MISNLLNKLNIYRNEISLTILFCISGVLLGFFISTFDIVVHAIFLEHFTRNDLALAFLFSGILGVIMFYIYSLAFKRMSYKFFTAINFTFVLIGTIAYFYIFISHPKSLWGYFLGLVIMFPLNILAFLIFWRHVRKTLRAHQRKRINPIIEFFVMLGFVLGGFGVTGTLLFYSYEILPIFTIGAFVLIYILQFIINHYHSKNPAYNHKKDRFVPVKLSFTLSFSSKYTSYLFLFAILSAIIGVLVHFSFISNARESFDGLIGMSKFYGVFIGCMFIFIFLAEKLLIHRILYSYDSPFSLILIPIAISIFLVITLVVDFSTGTAKALDRFTFFFILIGVTKISYEISKLTIQVPALRVLFKTLDIRYLQIIFPRIEGSSVMVGLLAAGGIIVGLTNLSIFETHAILLVLCTALLLSLGWIFVGFKLVKLYQAELRNTVKRQRVSRTHDKSESLDEKLRSLLVVDTPNHVLNALEISSLIQPLSYEEDLKRTMAHPKLAIKKFVLESIQKESLFFAIPELESMVKSADAETKPQLEETISNLKNRVNSVNSEEEFEKLLNSHHSEKKILAADVMGTGQYNEYKSSLINLTREIEPEVKLAAVKAMARLKIPDFSYLLIEFLSSPEYYAYAFEALVEIGDPSLEYLERVFITPGVDENVLARIVRIYGKIGTTTAVELLLSKLENQNRTIVNHVINALTESKFQASSLNVNHVLNVLVRVISNLAYNLLVLTTLGNKFQYSRLCMAFSIEVEENYRTVFRLLSLAYNSNTIRSIQDLVTKGSSNDISHAIEMLDDFVYEDIKSILFPVLEDISNIDKVKQLQYYFPVESQTVEEVLTSTLTRDFNKLSIYPRACAMLAFQNDRKSPVTQELAFNLFHPNPLLSQTAAYVLDSIDTEYLDQLMDRMDPHERIYLEKSLYQVLHENELLLIDKLALIKEQPKLASLNEEVQIEFAKSLRYLKFSENSEYNNADHQNDAALLLMLSGKARYILEEEDIYLHERDIIYNRLLINSGVSKIVFTEESEMFIVSKSIIEQLIFDYTDLAGCLLSCIEEYKYAN